MFIGCSNNVIMVCIVVMLKENVLITTCYLYLLYKLFDCSHHVKIKLFYSIFKKQPHNVDIKVRNIMLS